jgi:large subunit ribosomal protein L15
MKYNELETTAKRSKKRVGRGISAGGGKTAGRGTKGQKSRTGKKLRPTFAGGQRELVKAVPKKRGFKSLRVPTQVVYSDQLDDVKGAKIDNMALYEAGLITTPYHSVKIILRGETKTKATIATQGMSKSVVAQIEKNGGKFEKTAVPNLPSKTPSDSKTSNGVKEKKEDE